MPAVNAATTSTSCGLTNLAVCLPQKIFEYMLTIVNAPLSPLLSFVKAMLTNQINLNIFSGLWGTMVYIISLFYGLFFIVAGFNFMISGYDVEKRERAKSWFKDTVLMIFFVQSSYLLYSLVLDVASGLNTATMGLIDPKFFLLTTDSVTNIGLSLLFFIPYAIILLITAMFLVVRYVFVGVGVVFLPLGIFLYFIPPLKEFGKLVLNTIGVVVFLPFIQILILLAASQVINLSIFSNFKILVMISAFIFIDLIMILLAIFVAIKAAMSLIKSDVGKGVMTIVKMI